MQPNEVKPAIARQKVKLIGSNVIIEVLFVDSNGKVHGFSNTNDSGNGIWDVSICELFKEENRELKIGDHVIYQFGSCSPLIGTIEALVGDYVSICGERYFKKYVRHVLPEEEVAYFN